MRPRKALDKNEINPPDRRRCKIELRHNTLTSNFTRLLPLPMVRLRADLKTAETRQIAFALGDARQG
jgi:hypothetical protein